MCTQVPWSSSAEEGKGPAGSGVRSRWVGPNRSPKGERKEAGYSYLPEARKGVTFKFVNCSVDVLRRWRKRRRCYRRPVLCGGFSFLHNTPLGSAWKPLGGSKALLVVEEWGRFFSPHAECSGRFIKNWRRGVFHTQPCR